MEITEATPGDFEIIQQLARQVFFVTYLPLQPKEKVEHLFELMYTASSLAEQFEKGQKFVLAKDEMGYLGYASFELNHNGLLKTKIQKLYVLPTAQGKGVGGKLTEWIASRAQQSGNQTLLLNVYRKNPAITFYQKLGFSIAKEVDIPVGGGFVMEDYVMEKHLNLTSSAS